MNATELKTGLVAKTEAETTINPLLSVETGEYLRFTTVNQLEKRGLSLQYVEYGEVNFERVSDWMRFVNKLNNYDTTPILRMLTGDKKSLNLGGMIVTRDNYNEIILEFDNPIKLVVDEIGDKYIFVEVTKLKGELSWEWYHRRSGHDELGNYAGICEVFMVQTEIVE